MQPLATQPVRTVAIAEGAAPIVKVAIVGTFVILLLGALYYARSFVLPLVLAVLLTLTLSPLIRYLRKFRIPSTVSSILLVLFLGLGVGATSIFLSEPVAKMTAEMPRVIEQVRARFTFLKQPISAVNDAGKAVESMLDGSDGKAPAPKVVVAGSGGTVSWMLGTLADLGTTLAATLLLAPFLLASVDSFRLKLVHVLPRLSGKKRSLRVLHAIENEVSRYLITVTAINAGLGILVGASMALLGLGSPVFWGVTAALLNFVPYAGPTVGIVLVGATSLATHADLATAAGPPLVYLALQILEGGFVTPTILGRRLELSPIAILVMLSLTTWMWGIVGTIIGVPLLVVIKVFCDHFPSLATLGLFLSGEAKPIESTDEDDEIAESEMSASEVPAVSRLS